MAVSVDREERSVNGNKWWFGRLPPDNAELAWGARALLRGGQIEFVMGRSQYEPSGHPMQPFLRNYLIETVSPQIQHILAGAYDETEWGRAARRALTEYKHNGANAEGAARQDHGICHWEGIFSGDYVYLVAWVDETPAETAE